MAKLKHMSSSQTLRCRRWLLASLASLAFSAAVADDLGDIDPGVRVLSACFGGSALSNRANLLCAAPQNAPGEGFGGMPIVLSAQIDPLSLDPAAFRVKVRGQPGWVTPVCATLNPAIDPTERRTVLLVGDFGLGGANRPVAVRIVGDVRTMNGQSLKGLVTHRVTGTDFGPELVLAERLTPEGSDCPDGTAALVKLTFSGGPTGPNGAPLDADDTAFEAIQVVGVAGAQRRVLSLIALGDLGNDDHVDACFGSEIEGLTLTRIAVDSHVFFGPQNEPNRAASMPID